VYIELWEARSMYQAMRGPCMGGRAPGAGLTITIAVWQAD
jgi:hypothetical protein